MLKKVIVTFFNAPRRKRGFRLATFFNDLRSLKNGGTSLYRDRLLKNPVFHQPANLSPGGCAVRRRRCDAILWSDRP
jgi:hypothetical protein